MTDRSQAGFTLLELMVALVILGFIIAGLAAGTSVGFAAMGAQARAQGQALDIEPVDHLLRRMIADIALPANPSLPGLAGDRGGFVATTHIPSGNGGNPVPRPAPRVDAVVAIDARHRLVLRWVPHIHAERLAPSAAANEAVLLDGIDHIEVGYLSPDRSGWQDQWQRTDLPPLIRIRLVFAPGDPRRWPPIIASTRQMRIRAAQRG